MYVYISLGSNLGDRVQNLKKALQALPENIRVLRVSGLYETDPWGYEEQPAFLNQAAEIKTDLPPVELLRVLKATEGLLGRKPNFRYGPRQIDMDILFYGSEIISLPELQIPHPDLQQRAFVLVPLAELIPDFLHPVLLRTVKQLLKTQGSEGVRPYLQEEKNGG